MTTASAPSRPAFSRIFSSRLETAGDGCVDAVSEISPRRSCGCAGMAFRICTCDGSVGDSPGAPTYCIDVAETVAHDAVTHATIVSITHLPITAVPSDSNHGEMSNSPRLCKRSDMSDRADDREQPEQQHEQRDRQGRRVGKLVVRDQPGGHELVVLCAEIEHEADVADDAQR